MKIRLTAEQRKDFEYARHMFDLGNFKRADEILATIHPSMNHESLKWFHAPATETPPSERARQLVVTNHKGFVLEKDRIVIHSSEEHAARWGRENYGHGSFIIQTYHKFKSSQPGQFCIRRAAILQRLRAHRPSPSK